MPLKLCVYGLLWLIKLDTLNHSPLGRIQWIIQVFFNAVGCILESGVVHLGVLPGLSFQRVEGSKDLLMQRCWATAKTCGSKMDGLSVRLEIMKSA